MAEVERKRFSSCLPEVETERFPSSVSKAKTNRLSRSFRQSQQPQHPPKETDSPKTSHIDFKTPTRRPKSRYCEGFTIESPLSEYEFQQDIIWDATSPSPVRRGKRGKGLSKKGSIVDISEIVSRIAPKHGRPEVVEPTLQQWIGDSAAIPCTPDIQLSRPRKKLARPNGVDDLLKLAKQFDLQMFQQDAEEAEDSGPQLLFAKTSQPAKDVVSVVGGKDCPNDLTQDHHLEDDLNILFDGPTQHISGNLSQVPLTRSLEVTPASTEVPKRDSCPEHGPTLTVPVTNAPLLLEDVEGWENDFLNDSLLFEMTQNPQNFSPPRHSSAQRGPNETGYQRDGQLGVHTTGVARSPKRKQDSQSIVSKMEKKNATPRISFILEANPAFRVTKDLLDASTNHFSVSDHGTTAVNTHTQKNVFSSSKVLSAETGLQSSWQKHHCNKLNSQDLWPNQSTSISNSGTNCILSAAVNSNNSAVKLNSTRTPEAEVISNHKPTVYKEIATVPAQHSKENFLDEDLDAFFLSDSVWGDQEDDDMFREVCEDLESQALSVEKPPSVSCTQNERPVLVASQRVWDNTNKETKGRQLQTILTDPQSAAGRGGACTQSFSKNVTAISLVSGPSGQTRNSFAGNASSNHTVRIQSNPGKESNRYVQASSSSRTNSSACPSGRGLQSSGNSVKSQSTFKRPTGSVITMTNKAPGKCSAAEIEQKRQQAIERRRQRMQLSQNMRAPT
ncbi:ewing's tumor-associated antigen 1 [Lampris incognitus]|uniref:ewing's tumor-associated antigen 1 n=1 Tax=Lampris incognitus TaxID=2546036 RepID=UPI0024B54A03|nr:ewing's tumor-associated antigen 1 [Lampris incognitus]